MARYLQAKPLLLQHALGTHRVILDGDRDSSDIGVQRRT